MEIYAFCLYDGFEPTASEFCEDSLSELLEQLMFI